MLPRFAVRPSRRARRCVGEAVAASGTPTSSAARRRRSSGEALIARDWRRKTACFSRCFADHPPPMPHRPHPARARRYAVDHGGRRRARASGRTAGGGGRSSSSPCSGSPHAAAGDGAPPARAGAARRASSSSRRASSRRWCAASSPRCRAHNLVIEPAARGTAACLALAAAWIARRDPDAAMAVFPADHAIRDRRRAFSAACGARSRPPRAEDCLVTFGIPPTGAETGYGYVEIGAPLRRGAPRVDWAARFVEKPDRATARRFLDSGRYLWNSGMFVWRVPVLRAALRRHAPGGGAGDGRARRPRGAAQPRRAPRLPPPAGRCRSTSR